MKVTRLSTQFGRILRKARLDAGLSQSHFAKLVRISENHLSKLERGERLPAFSTMRKLRRILGPRTLDLLDPR